MSLRVSRWELSDGGSVSMCEMSGTSIGVVAGLGWAWVGGIFAGC